MVIALTAKPAFERQERVAGFLLIIMGLPGKQIEPAHPGTEDMADFTIQVNYIHLGGDGVPVIREGISQDYPMSEAGGLPATPSFGLHPDSAYASSVTVRTLST